MQAASSSPQKRFIRNVPHLNLEQAGPELDLQGNGKGFAGSTPGRGDSRRTSRSSSPTKHGGALLTPTSRDAFEKLRAELRMKNMEINELNVEIKTLKTIIAAKDIALQESDILCSTANEQLLKIRGEASTLRKELTNAVIERDKLQLEYRIARNEGELLDKASELEQEKLADRDKHITLVEKLRNDLAQVQKEMQQLNLDYKAVLKVIAAKDKALDEAFEKAERATLAMSELESSKNNAVGELKRRLTEAQWRIEFLQQQHEKGKEPQKKEPVRSPKPKLAATSPPEVTEVRTRINKLYPLCVSLKDYHIDYQNDSESIY